MSATIVLVHGAYAESASWNGVIPSLAAEGHRVIAWRNPLRGVASDAAELTDLVRSLTGPVVLCGHSYGGAVVTNVPADAGEIVALVYVAGFALAAGESCADAAALAPGSTLAETLVAVALSGGGADTYIDAGRFHGQFAADLPEDEAAIMAVTQRPITEAALSEPSGDAPLWAAVPSWFIFGELDRNIPAGAHGVMATRAGARHAREVPGASHVVGISHAAATARVILDAASASPRASAVERAGELRP